MNDVGFGHQDPLRELEPIIGARLWVLFRRSSEAKQDPNLLPMMAHKS